MDAPIHIAVLAIIIVYVCSQTLPEVRREQNACYGTHPSYSYNNANCSSNEIIATIDVIVGSKPSSNYSHQCPDIVIVQNPFPAENFEPCCRPVDGDGCYGSLNASNPNFHFRENCTGRIKCPDVQVGRIPTPELGCDRNIYYPDTHNFKMYYYCISVDKIGYIPSANLANNGGSALYLLGQNYPEEINIPSSACLVETDPGSSISVFVLDIRLKEDGGTCQQSITIIDGSSRRTIACKDNNWFNISVIYTSLSNSLILGFSNSFGTGGYFWLGFTASGSGKLTLSCDNGTINDETTTVSMTTDTSAEVSNTETTTSSTSSVTKTQASQSNEGSSTGIIGGAVGGLLLLLILLVLIILFCRYKKKKKREKEQEDNKQPIIDDEENVPDEDSNFPTIFTMNLPSQRHKILPPISTAFVKSMDDTEKKPKKNTGETNQNNEDGERKKHKKKKKRKKKNKVGPEDDTITFPDD